MNPLLSVLSIFIVLFQIEGSMAATQTEAGKSRLTGFLSDVRGDSPSKGIRIAYVKDSLTGTMKQKLGNSEIKDSADVNHDLGVGIGYVNNPTSGFGFRSQLLMNNYTKDTKGIRLDLGVSYSVSPMANLFLGINGHKFTSYNGEGDPKSLEEILPGGQIGTNIQFTENFGFDISYLVFGNKGQFEIPDRSDPRKKTKVNNEFSASGLETSLHVTF